MTNDQRHELMLARSRTVALDEQVWDLVHAIDKVLEGWGPGPAVAECGRLTRELAEVCESLSAIEQGSSPMN